MAVKKPAKKANAAKKFKAVRHGTGQEDVGADPE
jgi:hypothetical protein